jgi:RNA polymerase-interacting CarD/CdnL/TRCF family regulator
VTRRENPDLLSRLERHARSREQRDASPAERKLYADLQEHLRRTLTLLDRLETPHDRT